MKSAVSLADLIEAFGDQAGVLPEGLVLGSNRSDLPEVIQAVSRAGWTAAWNSDGRKVELGDLQDADHSHASFAVRPAPNVQVNFFLNDEEVLFDVDLRELVDQGALDAVCEVVKLLGARLRRPVTVSHEGSFDNVDLRYEPGLDEFTMSSELTP